ncbi:DUF6892 domain-containing protein [Curtobacterium sp. Leaf261]|uniref:DUF6892 domain-containing protein n=1 Tax=Curtobacterium sp. Leaf261 TaxID=1736311 RepID=UPI0006F55B93|nr:hypothetical protein [Curtobacterium sp. Leaf261]KQO65141.1 hypothetical protein ASF23_03200 [Curtobacterium sp. Leaf261]
MDAASNGTEEPYDFADFNAKLLVLEALCYDLDVLVPYTGGAEDGDEEGDAVEGQDALAREYYASLDVMPAQLELVTTLTIDGTLEIYQDVHPDWDGDDDRYDPQTWSDIVDLPALEAVWTVAPLPAHVDAELRAKGVTIETE